MRLLLLEQQIAENSSLITLFSYGIGWLGFVSGISSLIGSLKKNRAVVEELTASSDKEFSMMLDEIDRLLLLAAQIQEISEDRQAVDEGLTREVTTLEGEITAETRERSRLESTQTAQEKVTSEADTKLAKLKQDVPEAEKKLDSVEDEIRNTNRRLRELDSAIADAEKELGSLDTQHSDSITALQESAKEAEDHAKMLEAKYQALRFLLREQIISMPEAKIAYELKGKESITIDHLQKTTFIGRFRVKEILEEMDKRKIIKYDSGSGQVTVLKPIDL